MTADNENEKGKELETLLGVWVHQALNGIGAEDEKDEDIDRILSAFGVVHESDVDMDFQIDAPVFWKDVLEAITIRTRQTFSFQPLELRDSKCSITGLIRT
jgi:hypothetical protein